MSQALLGVAWILVGLLCVWSAIIARWLWAIAAVGGMWVIWGLGYAWAWAMGSGTGSDWISTGTYLLTGLALWTVTRQPDLPVHREED
ncbi:hypothetical protein BRM3_08855 [Brachybacterium huguangmaarense]|uniref:Uncharacterized protein n=1 Tax=Brachybacterium huguangmaarense TaxID=1652028 RepID=A0ABY6FXV3_9MICO|nr:hypothetical protein [Brachybacterium huguangmaarense]UYG15753.1 hypothetical protein BRM3_08855 [Brachybacterium huguangmaarense]